MAGEEVIVNRRLRRNITIDGDNTSELGFVFVDRPENDFETHRVLNNYLFGFKKWKSHVTERPLAHRSDIVRKLYNEGYAIADDSNTFEEETDERTSLLTDSIELNNQQYQNHSPKAWNFFQCCRSIPWNRPSTYFWLIIPVPILIIVHSLVFLVSWTSVIFIPIAKLNLKTIQQILFAEPERLKIEHSSISETPETDIIVYIHHAVNIYYYKYTIDGVNVIVANLCIFVVIALALGYLDKHNKYSSELTKLILAMLAIIPLAHYIGMAITCISAQSHPAVGAVLNATFGSVVEISLYVISLVKGAKLKTKCYVALVNSALTGTLLATMMLFPGLFMVIGGLKHSTQRFNPRAAAVSSTLLFVSVAGVFAPTIFSKAYGTLRCEHCVNSNRTLGNDSKSWPLSCSECGYSIFGLNGNNQFYYDHVAPLVYSCALILPFAYFVGLTYSLKTHRVHVYDTFYAQNEVPENNHSNVHWGRLKSLAVLLIATVVTSLCADIVAENIQMILSNSGISVYFIGVTLLALVPDLPEIVNGVQFALQNNISLSIEVASCIAVQVCLIQIPILVLVNVIYDVGFYMIFPDVHLWTVIFALLMMNYVFQDGKSDYFQGSAMCLVYVALILMYFFAPTPKDTVC
ncbi:DgyrCDS8942 [Dimorphilus gyrociliatus]|uniref:DgyrCDS8942 n=1 Tax=Dimorphilus gyrociliatus TaxID=2664684 RepID=A0A7I8VX50_9ANNE|nr:DgyrCDS8942 [Dimorphilus gyrociliatus]